MGEFLVKPSRHADVYVLWSTIVDMPTAYGSRAEMFDYLGGDVRGGERCPTCRHWVGTGETPSERLARADAVGCDARFCRPGNRWTFDDPDGVQYGQYGTIKRAHIGHLARLLGDNVEEDDPQILAMVEPWGD